MSIRSYITILDNIYVHQLQPVPILIPGADRPKSVLIDLLIGHNGHITRDI